MTSSDCCPRCGNPLTGIATFCWTCQEYVEDMEAGPGPTNCDKRGPAAAIPDARSEDERKADAREPVQALGWDVIDTEQGWRPFECPSCGARIPGGTRVERGFPDWLVMGHGLACFLEWKSAGGKQTEYQQAFQERCRVAGIPYRVVRTTEEAVAFLGAQRSQATRKEAP